MNKLLKISAAVALAMGAVSPSYAALVAPSTGNSQLALTIWDRTNSTSMIVSLNVDMQTMLDNGQNAAGYSILNAINSTDQADVASYLSTRGTDTIWFVSGADSISSGTVANRQVVVSGNNYNTPSASNPSTTNGAISSAALNANDFYGFVNAACPTDNTCTGSTGQLHYAGNANDWGTRMGGQLAAALNTGTQVGITQAFWYFNSGATTTQQASVKDRFDNAIDIGDWNLSAEGVLSYTLEGVSEVPLPAAVWLMLSGLAGFGAVSRRRQAAA